MRRDVRLDNTLAACQGDEEVSGRPGVWYIQRVPEAQRFHCALLSGPSRVAA